MDSPRPYYSVTVGHPGQEFSVDSRYQNLTPLGRGTTGFVVAADDVLTGKKVAIKRISRVFADLEAAKRIAREVKVLSHLGSHANVVELVDIMTFPPETEDFHTLYIVMSHFECTLDTIIRSEQQLTEQHAQYFLYQMMRALKYIHSAQVLHRDMKPSNILVNSNCNLAICDFGLARGLSHVVEPELTVYVATRWYRAPELLCEAEVYGTPVDVWSAGCIFAEILGGKPLFKGGSPREQLEMIITKLGTPTPDELAGITNTHVLEVIGMLGDQPGVPLSEIFPEASPLALDLLAGMLAFDQHRRITAEECLNHPYLHDFHMTTVEPLADSVFDTEFERGYLEDVSQDVLQALVFDQVMQLREKQRASGVHAFLHLTPAKYAAIGILADGPMDDAPATAVVYGPGSSAIYPGDPEARAGGLSTALLSAPCTGYGVSAAVPSDCFIAAGQHASHPHDSVPSVPNTHGDAVDPCVHVASSSTMTGGGGASSGDSYPSGFDNGAGGMMSGEGLSSGDAHPPGSESGRTSLQQRSFVT